MSSDTTKLWLETRLPPAAALRNHFTTPLWRRDAPYLGTLPALILGAVLFMALSGFVLSLFYDPRHPFGSIQFIDRQVNYGWLIHAFHATGTTMIFGLVYLTLFRAMVSGAYRAPSELVWVLSVAQLALLLLIGWLGYVMTGGAASYQSLHGVTSAIGGMAGLLGGLGGWFFGGPGGGTLARLGAFHVLLALALLGLLLLYGAAKRAVQPVPVSGRALVSFHPYYTSQYFAAFVLFALIFAVLVFFAPHLGENPLNRAAADRLLLPPVATPPWYLLPISGGIGAVGGIWPSIVIVLAMLAALFALPWLDRAPPVTTPRPLLRLLTVVLALDVILLGIAAAHQPSMLANVFMALFTAWYFLHFIVLVPLTTRMEAK